MIFGADYYPEHWPKERWPIDAKLMREAGMNMVRLAEFAWGKMEPAEGKFDFAWLDEAIEVLAAEGIKVVLGTPTASYPAWLGQHYPKVRRVESNRETVNYGGRVNYCVNSADYRKATDRVVRAMAEHYGDNPNVYGWQIDNEFGCYCYCEACQASFQEWLESKYGTLEALNAAWGTEFWAHIYQSWSQIPLPWSLPGSHNPGLDLDYRRFMADSFTSYAELQTNIIREYTDRPLTHNFMGFWPESFDYRAIAQTLDWAAWDNYPVFGAGTSAAAVGMAHDITRGLLHKNFWVMEQQSGPGGWGEMGPSPRPGQVRLYTYQSIAHGADGIIYFRWRVCRSGIEQYWHGILDHDGSTNRRYEEIKCIGSEVAKLWPLLEGTTVAAEAAVVNDYTSRWAWQAQKTNPEFNYVEEAQLYYRSLHGRSVPVDIPQIGDNLSGYKLVVVPAMLIISPERAEQLRKYVEDGGTLVMTYRSAVKDETSLIVNEPLPGMLRDLFGVRVVEYHSPHKEEENFIKGVAADLPTEATRARVFMDVLKSEGADTLAEYAVGFAAGLPAITMNTFGKGRAVYVGTRPDPEFVDALLAMLAGKSGLELGAKLSEDVEVAIRRSGEREVVFLMNYAREPRKLTAPEGALAVIGSDASGEIEIEPFGVRVFERQIKGAAGVEATCPTPDAGSRGSHV